MVCFFFFTQVGDVDVSSQMDAGMMSLIDSSKKEGHALVPADVDMRAGTVHGWGTLTMGARADSYYEYLLKMWIQGGKKDDNLRDTWRQSIL